MRLLLDQEIRDLGKATQLRLQEFAELVTAYVSGEITAEEAELRHYRYKDRWGDALPGTYAEEGISDAQLLEIIDAKRKSGFAKRLGRNADRTR